MVVIARSRATKQSPVRLAGSRFFPWKREFFADPLAELRFVGKK
jgi:hypothetical protein